MVLTIIQYVKGFGSEDGHEEGRIKCTNRFEYRHEIALKVGTCQDIIKSNPMCGKNLTVAYSCLLYTSPSPRDKRQSRMPSSA